jgi:GAF domain-containing protein
MCPTLTLAEALATAATQMSTRRPVDEVMQHLVNMVQRSLPGVDHAGISITHADGSIDTIAATDDLVLKFDQLQYELDEGPCLTAIRDEGVVVVNHADRAQRWPRFTERATALGLRSQMGVRLYANEQTLGGLNLYATQVDEIDPEVIHMAQLFASHAALALGHARVEENLLQAMTTRQRIGVAVGIVMERYGLDEQRAFQYLARVSQNSNVKLREIADEVVDSTNEHQVLPLEPPADEA